MHGLQSQPISEVIERKIIIEISNLKDQNGDTVPFSVSFLGSKIIDKKETTKFTVDVPLIKSVSQSELQRFLENTAIMTDYQTSYDLSTILNAWNQSGKSSIVDLTISQLSLQGLKHLKSNKLLDITNPHSILNYVKDQHENKFTMNLTLV